MVVYGGACRHYDSSILEERLTVFLFKIMEGINQASLECSLRMKECNKSMVRIFFKNEDSNRSILLE
ncbi:hypothetical protein L2E82_38460 [Cichorium intybus]|uniref:Uncharacterized protein n=1 Tax=Cichorium intybus TaxID=13427 RepID=A0ACB9AFH8_CICIN|nr:hypothetical protein L2E82_38460 [Cichorium intybus]